MKQDRCYDQTLISLWEATAEDREVVLKTRDLEYGRKSLAILLDLDKENQIKRYDSENQEPRAVSDSQLYQAREAECREDEDE